MGDEVVERPSGADVDPDLHELLEVLARGATDRDVHRCRAPLGDELHRPGGAHRFEHELRGSLDDAVDAVQGWAVPFVLEPERAPGTEIDHALAQRCASRIPPRGELLRLRPGVEDVFARGRKPPVEREEIKELRGREVLDALNDLLGPHIFPAKEDGGDPRLCPKCGQGQLSLKISAKNGAFIGCGRYPECNFTRQLAQSGEAGEAAALDGKVLGIDPETGKEVTLRNGRFGAYVQLGEPELDASLAVDVDVEKPKKSKAKPDKPKMKQPKRSSLPKGWDPASIDLERALKLLGLPRLVGDHPETKTPITAALGRFGPYIKHDGTYANVESIDDVFDIGVNRAVTVLAEKRAGGGKSRFQRAKPTVLVSLGEHPAAGGKIDVLEGKYGPYVSHNGVNATVPKGIEPDKLSVDEAIRLLDERIAKGGGSKFKKGAKKAAPKTAAAKSEAATKAPAKKPVAKKSATKAVSKKKVTKAKADAD